MEASHVDLIDALVPELVGDYELPAELEDSLQRHRRELKRLVAALRSAGVSEQMIEESVSVMIASYRDELILALKGTMR